VKQEIQDKNEGSEYENVRKRENGREMRNMNPQVTECESQMVEILEDTQDGETMRFVHS
jgi:hypothetical protein